MKILKIITMALVFGVSIQFNVQADWQVYDDFNDNSVDSRKWTVTSFGGGGYVENFGYLTLIANKSAPTVGGYRRSPSSVFLNSKLEQNDVIRGLRISYYLAKVCDSEADFDFLDRYIPVGFQSVNLAMSTNSLTHNTVPRDNHVATRTEVALVNDSYLRVYSKSGVKTTIESRFNDGGILDSIENSSSNYFNGMTDDGNTLDSNYTTNLQQLTTQFIDPARIETTLNWSKSKSISNDSSMRMITANRASGRGQLGIFFSATPVLAGASEDCRIHLDKVEVYR